MARVMLVNTTPLVDGSELQVYVTLDDDRGNQSENHFEIRHSTAGAIVRMDFRSLVFWMAWQVLGVPMPQFIDVQGLHHAVGLVPKNES